MEVALLVAHVGAVFTFALSYLVQGWLGKHAGFTVRLTVHSIVVSYNLPCITLVGVVKVTKNLAYMCIIMNIYIYATNPSVKETCMQRERGVQGYVV